MQLPLIIGSIFGLAAMVFAFFHLAHYRGLVRRDREVLGDEDDVQRT